MVLKELGRMWICLKESKIWIDVESFYLCRNYEGHFLTFN